MFFIFLKRFALELHIHEANVQAERQDNRFFHDQVLPASLVEVSSIFVNEFYLRIVLLNASQSTTDCRRRTGQCWRLVSSFPSTSARVRTSLSAVSRQIRAAKTTTGFSILSI